VLSPKSKLANILRRNLPCCGEPQLTSTNQRQQHVPNLEPTSDEGAVHSCATGARQIGDASRTTKQHINDLPRPATGKPEQVGSRLALKVDEMVV